MYNISRLITDQIRTLITICARGGSKGIPGKNVKLLAGKPLIEYTFDIARQFKSNFADTDIALSTDSKEITESSNTFGGTHRSPRQHLRRGHIRRLPTKKVWVNSAIIGNSKNGIIQKDYAVI